MRLGSSLRCDRQGSKGVGLQQVSDGLWLPRTPFRPWNPFDGAASTLRLATPKDGRCSSSSFAQNTSSATSGSYARWSDGAGKDALDCERGRMLTAGRTTT